MNFEIGKTLTHKKFGIGTITKITERKFAYGLPDQPIITIDFGHIIGTRLNHFKQETYTSADFIPQTINSDNFEL